MYFCRPNGNNQFDHLIFVVIVPTCAVFDLHTTKQNYIRKGTHGKKTINSNNSLDRIYVTESAIAEQRSPICDYNSCVILLYCCCCCCCLLFALIYMEHCMAKLVRAAFAFSMSKHRHRKYFENKKSYWNGIKKKRPSY